MAAGAGKGSNPARPSSWILVAAICGSGLVYLDGSLVNLALPRIGHDLPSTALGVLEGQTYVYAAFLLSLSTMLMLSGSLSDRFGRRRLFVLGLAGFEAASLLCAVAPTIEWLIVFRVVEGFAAALLVPGGLALIAYSFHGPDRAFAFGWWVAGSGLTTLLAPFFGGPLIDAVSWRAAFLVGLPLAALALYATYWHVPESSDSTARGSFDFGNALLLVVASAGLTFGPIYAQQHGWGSWLPWVLVGTGLTAAATLPFTLARTHYPLVDLRLFLSRDFTIVNLMTLLVYGGIYVSYYYESLFLQGALGYSAVGAGLALLPASVMMIAVSPFIAALADRWGPRLFVAGGPLVIVLAFLWFVRTPPSSSPWHLDISNSATWLPPAGYLVDVFPAILVFGIGHAILASPLTNTLMSSVEPRFLGIASGFNNTMARVGPQLAGALTFVTVSAMFRAGLGSADSGMSPFQRPGDADALLRATAASTMSFHVAMGICAFLVLAGALVALIGFRDRPFPAGPGTPLAAAVEAADPQPAAPATLPAKTRRRKAAATAARPGPRG